MRRRKGQAAIEYMLIAAIVIAFLIPIWAYMSGVRSQTNIQLMLSYAKNTADRLSDTAELVYSQGPPAKMTIKIYIPRSMEYVRIMNRTINLGIRTLAGVSDVFAISRAEVNGTLPISEGIYWVTVEAHEGLVQIHKSTE